MLFFFFFFFGKMEQMVKSLHSNQQIKQNPVPAQTPRPQIQSKQSQQHISTHMAQKLNFNQCPIQPNTKISHLCANSVKSRIRNIRNKTTIKKSNTERERERERENRRSSPSTTFVIDQNVKRLLWVVVLSDEGWSDFLMRELGIFKLWSQIGLERGRACFYFVLCFVFCFFVFNVKSCGIPDVRLRAKEIIFYSIR